MCSENRKNAEEALKLLRPIYDNFFGKLFRDSKELTQLVLRLFMNKPDLEVLEHETQYDLKRLPGARSIYMDIKATYSTKYNIEARRKLH